jgi:acyl-CoA synthetase (AMP-forming)/AMP-acid ligase II
MKRIDITEDGIGPGSGFHAPSVLRGRDFKIDGQPDGRLDGLFERLAERYGAFPAVVSDGRTWTYGDVDARANQLARVFANHGVKPGARVALLLDRSAMTYVAILAVMKAGGIFVPLATAFPPERMSLIIEDAAIELVVTVAGYSHIVNQLPIANYCSMRLKRKSRHKMPVASSFFISRTTLATFSIRPVRRESRRVSSSATEASAISYRLPPIRTGTGSGTGSIRA